MRLREGMRRCRKKKTSKKRGTCRRTKNAPQKEGMRHCWKKIPLEKRSTCHCRSARFAENKKKPSKGGTRRIGMKNPSKRGVHVA